MKIRTQFALSTLLALAMALGVGIVLWMANQQAETAEAERRLAQDTAHHTANLLVLTQEYALHFDERAAQQWQNSYGALSTTLNTPAPGRNDRLLELSINAHTLPETFTSLMQLADEIGEAGETPLNARRKDFLVDRILSESQALADGAHRWSREAAETQSAAEERLHGWGAAAFGISAALLLMQALVVVRRVLQPVLRLQEAAAAVERGDLRTQLDVDTRDELGDLKRSFNAMTAALAQRSAELDQEVARRQQSEAFVRTITDNLPLLVTYLDHEERFRFVNAPLESWMGVSPEQALGRTVEDVIGSERYATRRDALRRALQGERVTFEVDLTHAGRTLHLHNVYIPDVRADGQVAGLYAVSSDVTELKVVQQQLDALARVDALTGLTNRRGLQEKLDQALARRSRTGTAMAAFYLDVDRFKQINDRHGHGVGDEVLQEIARRLQSSVRGTDTPARLGGDEFVVLVECLASADEADLVARKVLQALEPDIQTSAGPLPVRSSVGVAFVDAHHDAVTAEPLLALADKALYEAKGAGRACHRVMVWAPEPADVKPSFSDTGSLADAPA